MIFVQRCITEVLDKDVINYVNLKKPAKTKNCEKLSEASYFSSPLLLPNMIHNKMFNCQFQQQNKNNALIYFHGLFLCTNHSMQRICCKQIIKRKWWPTLGTSSMKQSGPIAESIREKTDPIVLISHNCCFPIGSWTIIQHRAAPNCRWQSFHTVPQVMQYRRHYAHKKQLHQTNLIQNQMHAWSCWPSRCTPILQRHIKTPVNQSQYFSFRLGRKESVIIVVISKSLRGSQMHGGECNATSSRLLHQWSCVFSPFMCLAHYCQYTFQTEARNGIHWLDVGPGVHGPLARVLELAWTEFPEFARTTSWITMCTFTGYTQRVSKLKQLGILSQPQAGLNDWQRLPGPNSSRERN